MGDVTGAAGYIMFVFYKKQTVEALRRMKEVKPFLHRQKCTRIQNIPLEYVTVIVVVRVLWRGQRGVISELGVSQWGEKKPHLLSLQHSHWND